MLTHEQMEKLVGYFDAPEQTKPAFDPGVDVPCPGCVEKLSDPMRTDSIFPIGNKSYFFRFHKKCANRKGTRRLEAFIVDELG